MQITDKMVREFASTVVREILSICPTRCVISIQNMHTNNTTTIIDNPADIYLDVRYVIIEALYDIMHLNIEYKISKYYNFDTHTYYIWIIGE